VQFGIEHHVAAMDGVLGDAFAGEIERAATFDVKILRHSPWDRDPPRPPTVRALLGHARIESTVRYLGLKTKADPIAVCRAFDI
jgi:hypothetical protein